MHQLTDGTTKSKCINKQIETIKLVNIAKEHLAGTLLYEEQ